MSTLSHNLQERADRISRIVNTSAYEIGRELIAAKEQCRHGEWQPFLEKCNISRRAAQRVMRYVRLVGRVEDLRKLPSMTGTLRQDDGKRAQEFERGYLAIFNACTLLANIFNALHVRDGGTDETIQFACIVAAVHDPLNEHFESVGGLYKPEDFKCVTLSHLPELAKAVGHSLGRAIEFMKTQTEPIELQRY